MHNIVTNLRGTRAFDNTAGKVVALAAGALGLAALTPVQATPAHHRSIWAIRWDAAHPALAAMGRHTPVHTIRLAGRPVARPVVRVADFAPTPYLPANIVRVASVVKPLPVTKHLVKPMTETVDPAEDVTLDFVAADIADVLKALAMQTHTNIVAGTDVKGNVTVSLAHVSLDEALNMISHLSGFQYAKVGNSYVVGSAATLAAMGGTDAAQTAMINYLYSNPDDLTGIIKQVAPAIKITSGKTTGGSGGMLVVTGSTADLEQARQIVQQAESALSHNITAAQTVVYDIKYSSPDDLQTVLGRLVPDLIVTPGPSQRLPPVAPSTADAGGTTSTTTSYGATTAGATVTAVTADLPVKPTTSSLLLTGGDADITRARQILATVDVRPAQINFAATITDLDTNLARNLGLTYDFANATTTIGELIPVGKMVGQVPVDYPGQILKTGTFGRTQLNQFVTVGLQAAQTKGDARILASPNISAIDGLPAAIFIGNNITYVSSITSSPTGQNVTTATVSAGVKLFITGKVNNDGYITVNLHPEVSTYTLTATTGGAQLPNIATREATTTLRVRDGDYIALGGLAQSSEAKTSLQVPLLSDIPVIGNLFRSDTKTREHRELTIFIKVSIAKDQQ